jgi:hypothetical protein
MAMIVRSTAVQAVASGKNMSFHDSGFFLMRPTLYMKSTIFITVMGVVV